MAVNSMTYTGVDGTLTLSDPNGLEADAYSKYFGESGVVARIVGVTLSVQTEIHAFHELGARLATELRTGNIAISGAVERAYVNGALLKAMLGKYADNDETPGMAIPTFSLKILLDSPLTPDEKGGSVLTAMGVVFDRWDWRLPEDEFTMERMTFRARRLAVQDTEL